MNAHVKAPGASIIPTVRYRDVPAAIAWLQNAFGFETHRLVKGAKGPVVYGELKFGSGMVMIAPVQETPFGKLMVQPDEIGGVETQICYLFVDDAPAHLARAKAAGAEIVLDIERSANGDRGYSCRDLEGHVWNFGTHNPWKAKAAGKRSSRRAWKVIAACLMLAAAGGVAVHEPARGAAGDLAFALFTKVSAAVATDQAEQTPDRGADSTALQTLRDELSKERLARVAADRHVKDIREQLARERRAREAAELAAKTAGENLQAQASMPPPAAPGQASQAAEAAATQARNDLAKTRIALQTAAQQLAEAQKAKDAAERDAKEARDQSAQVRHARESAEHAAKELRDLAARERGMRIAAQRALRRAMTSSYKPYTIAPQ